MTKKRDKKWRGQILVLLVGDKYFVKINNFIIKQGIIGDFTNCDEIYDEISDALEGHHLKPPGLK